ncbi:MAG: metalloprotease TldD [Sphingomonadales bacterium]|jgi:TldD protein
MTNTPSTTDLFFTRTGLDEEGTTKIVENALQGMDDGELYFEYNQSEMLGFDDGRLKTASFDTHQGFGLRAVFDEATGYAHSTDLSEGAIKRAAETVKAVRTGKGGIMAGGPTRTNRHLYDSDNPINAIPFEDKVALLEQINSYARTKDPSVVQVSASLAGQWQAIEIIRADGTRLRDVRPLVRLNVSIVTEKGDRREQGYHGLGGRRAMNDFFDTSVWQGAVDEALRQALVNLDSVAAPAGEMTVVLGPGWPGVLLHEAVGHGLEGDFNRKKTSAFSGLLGERVAAPGVTVVDDGSIEGRRGSLSIDDEGTPTSRTVLIEDGILKGYMQDRLNARLMNMAPTGNGRRESFAHTPMPRMTNTFMLGGQEDPRNILSSVKDGIYAKNFGGGQVDITSGKFVFSCTEAYKIENGKIGAPIKGATLIGSGPEVLKHVKAIGNDLELDTGIGVCGKGGQSIPAGVGQPTLLIDKLTVGGTGA